MTVQSDPAFKGEKELKTEWPHEEGLILGTTKIDGRVSTLEPEECSYVSERKKVGFT